MCSVRTLPCYFRYIVEAFWHLLWGMFFISFVMQVGIVTGVRARSVQASVWCLISSWAQACEAPNTLAYSGKTDEHMLNFQFINASLNSVRALCAWPQLKFEPKYLWSVGSDLTKWTIVFFGRGFGNCAKLLWAEIHSVTPIVPLYLCLLLTLFQHSAIFHVSNRSGKDWLNFLLPLDVCACVEHVTTWRCLVPVCFSWLWK